MSDGDAEFLASWFGGCAGSVQLVALAPDGGQAPELYHVDAPHGWDAAMRWAHEQSAAALNVYFCPLAQPPGSTGHRREATADELPGVFADIDDVTLEAAWPLVTATGLVSAGVASGNGLHVYGRFVEPVRVTAANREQLKDTLFAYGAAMNAAAHGEARRPERHDLASLLRVPGTTNWPNTHKRAQGRVPTATHVVATSERRLALADFNALAARHPRPHGAAAIAPPPPSTEERIGPTAAEGGRAAQAVTHAPDGAAMGVSAVVGELPAHFAAWLAADPVLRGYFTRTLAPRGRDQSPSAYALALANRLAKTHPAVSDGEALARCTPTTGPDPPS